MSGKKKRKSAYFGALLFFVTIAVTVSAAVLTYSCVADKCGDNKAVIASVMLAVIVFLAAVCTLIDWIRRRFTVDKPVNRILEASDKIAKGDFSVRLEITHPYGKYDEYDFIMENFNKMAAELSRTEVLHTDFISNVSHEMKTPLSVIRTYASSLASKELEPEIRKKYAQTVVATSEKLADLVANILKLNKLENSEIKAETKSVELSESLAESVVFFEELIERKGLNLYCDFEENVRVTACPEYLEIVWKNLLSNALKFTAPGGDIRVTLRKFGGRAVVSVADTGCGISPEIGAHVFEKFFQGDTSHSQEGNGLGLALVKKVIDITGGEISVSSEEGKGTAFTVSLKAESDA